MKRVYLLLTGLFLFCGLVGAQNETISFNETDHDFGTIGEKDGNATFDFVLTNNSKEPIVITNVVASCGCTKPSWTKEPIEPNKKGTITISYNPVGRLNSFVKNITVSISNQTPISLKIRGMVVPAEVAKKNPQDEYPVALGNYLLKTKDLSFGRVEWNEAKTMRLEVFNNSDKSLTQKVQKLPKYITVAFEPAVIPAKTAGVVSVTLNVQDNNSYGNLSGEFTLLINEDRQTFPYSATVLDDFSQWDAAKKASAGKINISASEINFGNFGAGSSKMLRLSNSGKSPLNVRAVQSSDPSVTVSKSRFVINPQEIVEIKVNVDSKKFQSKQVSKLSIVTDDPNTPIYEINVVANNQKP